MFTLNDARAVKTCLSMKSETLSLKIVIKELDFLRKTIIFNETLEEKRFIGACEQISRKYT